MSFLKLLQPPQHLGFVIDQDLKTATTVDDFDHQVANWVLGEYYMLLNLGKGLRRYEPRSRLVTNKGQGNNGQNNTDILTMFPTPSLEYCDMAGSEQDFLVPFT